MTQADIVWDQTPSTVSFGQNFVQSEAFRHLFKEGMALVEETAHYLDGKGREDSAALDRHTALLYASESMRLTTRLMQVASWLLVQRAVSEGEITTQQALHEKNRVRLGQTESVMKGDDLAPLPETLQRLLLDSQRLHQRILHLDNVVSSEAPVIILPESPVAIQQWLLREAFEGIAKTA